MGAGEVERKLRRFVDVGEMGAKVLGMGVFGKKPMSA